jgi:hypothetical protein
MWQDCQPKKNLLRKKARRKASANVRGGRRSITRVGKRSGCDANSSEVQGIASVPNQKFANDYEPWASVISPLRAARRGKTALPSG